MTDMNAQPLPEDYKALDDAVCSERIARRKKELGKRLVILGHHYQCDAVLEQADYIGDSLRLAQLAAAQEVAKYIVFCGVHFMAESADILTDAHQMVFLPDATAGCPMADMADIEQVQACWNELTRCAALKTRAIIPVCYVNSSAKIKAFCGEHNGLCCTSSNCRQVFAAVWKQYPDAVILFLPDEHLARNTGWTMGLAVEQMILFDPDDSAKQPVPDEHTRMVLWKGHCHVHQNFTAEQVMAIRVENPGMRIIVHPECPFDVVRTSDMAGSTDFIIKTIEASEPESQWAVGTEGHLVERLKTQMAEKNIIVQNLADAPAICDTMSRGDLKHLLWVLDHIARYDTDDADTAAAVPNQVQVDADVAKKARKALQGMLDVTAKDKY